MVSAAALLVLSAACAAAPPREPEPMVQVHRPGDSWSDLIAGAYAYRLKTIFKRSTNETSAEPSAFKRYLSQSLQYFKDNVFDRVWQPPRSPKQDAERVPSRLCDPRACPGAQTFLWRLFSGALFEDKTCCESGTESPDPNEDVEELQDVQADQRCPGAGCRGPAPARLVLAVPPQCPAGYRRDWLGFCRMIW